MLKQKVMSISVVIMAFLCIALSSNQNSILVKAAELDLNCFESGSENYLERQEDVIDEIAEERTAVDQKENTDDDVNLLYKMSDSDVENYFYLNKWECGEKNTSAAYEVTNPVSYLHKNVDKSIDTYTVSSKLVTGVSSSICNDFSGDNNCTLTALFNLMVYYRNKGYSRIPSNKYSLYNVIKKQAINLGYTDKSGLSVTKNNNLVTNTWTKGLGYSNGSGSTTYFWNKNTVIDYISNNKPVIFSLASGYYYNHSIAIYGYKTYTNTRTKSKYKFLVVSDGWSRQQRYLAWTNTGEGYIGALTTVNVPSKKS